MFCSGTTRGARSCLPPAARSGRAGLALSAYHIENIADDLPIAFVNKQAQLGDQRIRHGELCQCESSDRELADADDADPELRDGDNPDGKLADGDDTPGWNRATAWSILDGNVHERQPCNSRRGLVLEAPSVPFLFRRIGGTALWAGPGLLTYNRSAVATFLHYSFPFNSRISSIHTVPLPSITRLSLTLSGFSPFFKKKGVSTVVQAVVPVRGVVSSFEKNSPLPRK